MSVFAGLLTVTNERGEIGSINLVPTKAHNQFESSLRDIHVSLSSLSHLQPVVFYTDNVAGDSKFLRDCFPSLNFGVKPMSKWDHLPEASLPSAPIILDTVAKVDAALKPIFDSTSLGPGELVSNPVVVGLDAEWPVLLEYGPHGGVVKSTVAKDAAVVQIVWRKNVYILMVSSEVLSSEEVQY